MPRRKSASYLANGRWRYDNFHRYRRVPKVRARMLVVDPIEDPNFNPARARPANPERIKQIRQLAKIWRMLEAQCKDAREEMAEAIREAKRAGHSYPQLAEAAGVSMGVIQRMVADGE